MSRIFIRNLPSQITEKDLENLFSDCGMIDEIVLKTNFAFIQFSSEEFSERAIKLFNDYPLRGNKITVEQAKTRTEKLAERVNEKCFKCGETGHWAKDCKVKKREYPKYEKKKKFRHSRKSPRRSFSRSISSVSSHKSRSRSRD